MVEENVHTFLSIKAIYHSLLHLEKEKPSAKEHLKINSNAIEKSCAHLLILDSNTSLPFKAIYPSFLHLEKEQPSAKEHLKINSNTIKESCGCLLIVDS